MENRPKKAGLVLEDVRQQYAKSGSIENSWIDYDPIEYDLFESNPLVYIGGVTVAVDGKIQQYQFAADIYTGDIIDSFEIK